MKSIASILVCIVILFCGCLAGLAEYDSTIMLSITDDLDETADEFYSSAFNRAFLTLAIALDVKVKNPSFDLSDIVNYPSYVGYDNDGLLMIAYVTSGDEAIYVLYTPGTEQGTYGTFSGNYGGYIEYMMEESSLEYKKNSTATISGVVSDLADYLENQ